MVQLTNILLLLAIICSATSYRLLVIYVMPSRSHYILGSSLAKGLSEAGHDVSILAPYKDGYVSKNGIYNEIYLDGTVEEFEKKQISMWNMSSTNPISTASAMSAIFKEMVNGSLAHRATQNLLKSKEHFDAVIIEQFMNDAYKGFAHHFNAPLILSSSVGPNPWVNKFVANPYPPSYVTSFFTSYTGKMNFWQRMANTLSAVLSDAMMHLLLLPIQESMYNSYFPDAPEFSDVLYNVSLVLLNSHISIGDPVPLVPSMIPIGGYHIKPPKKLPTDLQEFLDKAEHGVIYFSMGSNLKSKEMPKNKIESLLKAFSKLKQKVLWKWEDEILPGQPKNLKIGKWFPQQDILAHPNVKLFITHGGLLSNTETIYHGVPVLSIPVFGDQNMNAAQMVHKGYGLKLDLDDLDNANKIYETINELLTNPKYAETAKRRSRILHDQPFTPMETANFWVEYVIRHKGAQHLRVAGVDLPWYQYLLLDVFAFLFAIPVVIFLGIRCLIKRRNCCKNKIQKNKKLKTK